VVGVLIVNVINNGMVVIGLPDFLQDGVLGLLVIVAVVLSTDRRAVSFVK
jgi:ribose transport system permease protein